MSIPAAATDGVVFCAWLEQLLLPELRRTRPDAVLVMDNLSAHKTKAVRALLDDSGFAYLYLPRYSPNMNPIEPAWAKVKGLLRKAATPTVEGVHAAPCPALAAITKDDARGFFRHAGMAVPTNLRCAQPLPHAAERIAPTFIVARRAALWLAAGPVPRTLR